MRRPLLSYVDPLDGVWLSAAATLGLRVVRDPAVYASYDGRGTLALAPDADLDSDDCLAQMILHELCHALVQGEAAWGQLDWGLFEADASDAAPDFSREYACLRVQAALLRPYGLDQFLAPTTDFRTYYDALPANPIEGQPGDPSIPLARAALGLAYSPKYRRILQQALRQTAHLHAVVQTCIKENIFVSGTLWQKQEGSATHPAGFPLHPQQERGTCGTCAWYHKGTCQQHDAFFAESNQLLNLESNTPACVLHESQLDCKACAACCRHGYGVVPVTQQDTVSRTRPDLIENKDGFLQLRRVGNPSSCLALGFLGPTQHQTAPDFFHHRDEEVEMEGKREEKSAAYGLYVRSFDDRVTPQFGPAVGDERSLPLFSCKIYEDRPAACSDLERGSAACLTARKRVGLSL